MFYNSLQHVIETSRSIVPAALGRFAKSQPLTEELSLLCRLRSLFIENRTPIIVLANSSEDGLRIHQFLEAHRTFISSLDISIEYLPDVFFWGRDRYLDQFEANQQRQRSLHCLWMEQAAIVVMTPMAFSTDTLSAQEYRASIPILNVQDEIEPDVLGSILRAHGYVEVSEVKEPGEYSWRGMIFDLFPLNEELPVRLHFLADEISRISYFNADTQLSSGSLERIAIASHFDWQVSSSTDPTLREKQAQILFDELNAQGVDAELSSAMVRDYLRQGFFTGIRQFSHLFRQSSNLISRLTDPLRVVFSKDPDTLLRNWERSFSELKIAAESDREQGLPVIMPDEIFDKACFDYFKEMAAKIELDPVDARPLDLWEQLGTIFSQQDDRILSAFLDLCDQKLLPDEWSVLICLKDEESLKRLIRFLELRSHSYIVDHHAFEASLLGRFPRPGLVLSLGLCHSYQAFTEEKILIVSDQTIFSEKRHPSRLKSKRKSIREILLEISDLRPGDLIVHILHGIGKFLGMTNIQAGGATGDYLILEYKGGDRIYLPVDRLDLLQRYSSDESQSAALDQLGGAAFTQKKNRAKAAAQDMAGKLLKIYAARKLSDPRIFGPISETYLRFESDFPYQETEDQLRALDDIEQDFVSDKLMDRLVCGDVGFGKTEVAIRAAMRTVLEGYQVMVLVPTTILCFQHFRSFSARMSQYGVEVRQVNRFVKGPRIQKILHDFSEGKVDVLIGTHRILSNDVVPKNLSLLVVDEEQRFGVGHKERIKELKATADVLTLSATPIPRTLHLAMLGLRDISLITTPPTDRLPVKTYIAKFDEELIKDAIQAEIRRGGQVFFVHNRVDDIQQIASYLHKLIPDLSIAVAHGQMHETALENVILDFIAGKQQILICTTIIESGIDMPNVNTLIVNRADMYGLAQLYQLRGRVGRSSRQASAYFLVNSFDILSDEAMKRLEVLGHHQDLGSGFAIANFDLEIRGAGNLLGAEQSGHALAVGLEFYTKLLEEAIAEARGDKQHVAELNKPGVEIKLNINAFLSSTYIEVESLRLKTYRRIFAAKNPSQDSEIRRSLQDQFGPLPKEVQRLFIVVYLKRMLECLRILQIVKKDPFSVELKFGVLEDQVRDRLLTIIREQADVYKMLPQSRILVSLRPSRGIMPVPDEDLFLTWLCKAIENLGLKLGIVGFSELIDQTTKSN